MLLQFTQAKVHTYIYFQVDKTFWVNLIQSVIVGMHTQVPTIYVYVPWDDDIYIFIWSI